MRLLNFNNLNQAICGALTASSIKTIFDFQCLMK